MSFWTDAKVIDDFTPEDKYFYLYLITNPHTNLVGCYEISLKQMSDETGYTRETIEKLLDRFINIHKVIKFSKTNKEILLLNWHKHNWTKSEKLDKPLVSQLEDVKTVEFKRYLGDLISQRDTVSIPYLYRIDTTDTDTDTDNITNNLSSKKDNIDIYIDMYNFDEETKEVIKEWLKYKNEKRQGYKDTGLKSFIKQVYNKCQQYGFSDVREVIEKSMGSNYQGVVWDWLNENNSKSKKGDSNSGRTVESVPERVFESEEDLERFRQAFRRK